MDQRLLRRRRARKKHKSGFSYKLLKNIFPDSIASGGYKRFVYDQLQFVILPLLIFFKDAARVFKRCTKPNRYEFRRTVLATILGFFLMGFIVKLLHIPITNIIMG